MRPEIFALLAALSNGLIGPLTRIGFLEGAGPNEIAFFKCLIAFLVLLLYVSASPRLLRETLNVGRRVGALACLAFFGIFCLYFFETTAFFHASIPTVSFLTYAGGVVAIIFSYIFLHEPLTKNKIFSFAVIIAGVYMIIVGEAGLSASIYGIMFALLGGTGYSIFIFLVKYFRMQGGIPTLLWLFGFGTIYLSLPYAVSGGGVPSLNAMFLILTLVLIPTIGGFYFTTRAIAGGEASRVQIIETSDPLFASAFGLVLFGDHMSLIGWGGAALIFSGLMLLIIKPARVASP